MNATRGIGVWMSHGSLKINCDYFMNFIQTMTMTIDQIEKIK